MRRRRRRRRLGEVHPIQRRASSAARHVFLFIQIIIIIIISQNPAHSHTHTHHQLTAALCVFIARRVYRRARELFCARRKLQISYKFLSISKLIYFIKHSQVNFQCFSGKKQFIAASACHIKAMTSHNRV